MGEYANVLYIDMYKLSYGLMDYGKRHANMPVCGPYIVETPGERNFRLEITKQDIRTFRVDDELKGTEYEQEKGGSRKIWAISTREMIAICANLKS